jgi:hypothetical protein
VSNRLEGTDNTLNGSLPLPTVKSNSLMVESSKLQATGSRHSDVTQVRKHKNTGKGEPYTWVMVSMADQQASIIHERLASVPANGWRNEVGR